MSQPETATLAYWSEHRSQLRQSETQRSQLTNYLLAITAALSVLIVQQKFAAATLPLSALITATGVYGALASAKYHERAEYHLQQARVLTRTLVGIGALGDDTDLSTARETHYCRYRILHRVRLHQLWTGLHLGIAAYGITLMLITLIGR
ncbi:hypothetical protein [Dactylosporangium matsuzakiense]|uniref:Uncharacterized protein n=1 Tax=Dactylosporangium matsuzakiense TaxID=53360 RepID=A0A9W6KXS8_9ACTN|nr:hypothetical protein [Dactylosporangium matsuzakiense]UWZ44620.1 hypothetical protein Dmats_46020 [Dactylosporangium matsuzakiense]GLL08526.1 hypothetical protein GCM10017581_102930 [Dactylosporangium matsuzakiense]